MAEWLRSIRWVLAMLGAVAAALAIAWVLLVPTADWLASHDVGQVGGALRTMRLQTARDAARGRLLTLAAGLFAVAALVYTARNFTLSREGQVTDRYTKAIEQIGSDKLDVRIGGIYALERIARDSPKDHPTVIEVLAAFIREHSHMQWPEADPAAKKPERTTRPDVQAAVTVVARRDPRHDRQAIDLSAANLSRANLTDANLGYAALARATLTGANLGFATLNDATLAGADLTSANLIGATLTGADLTGADLNDATLAGANLGYASLSRATLTGADLGYATLNDANLTDANLTGADLTRADLTRAKLNGANLTGADLTRANLNGANLTDANLDGAGLSEDVRGPDGWVRDPSGRLRRASGGTGDAGN